MNAKKKMGLCEKIDNLCKVRKNLEKKLKILAQGRPIIEFDYTTPQQWREMVARGEIKLQKKESEEKEKEGEGQEGDKGEQSSPAPGSPSRLNFCDPFDSDLSETGLSALGGPGPQRDGIEPPEESEQKEEADGN